MAHQNHAAAIFQNLLNSRHRTANTAVVCNIELLIERNIEPYKNVWALPGGFVRINETLEEAAIRELKEETGIEAGAKQLSFGSKVFVRYSDYDFTYHIFHLRLNLLPVVTLNPEEHKAYQWLSPQKALRIELIKDEASCMRLFYNL